MAPLRSRIYSNIVILYFLSARLSRHLNFRFRIIEKFKLARISSMSTLTDMSHSYVGRMEKVIREQGNENLVVLDKLWTEMGLSETEINERVKQLEI